ncbi:carbohydrate ABC transporter permease [Cohnella herbarum]|uniref:Carbohydrate ABC transporter permease n=1 Tax=Cohnella herbarum TaxID=2728023 RepID=A0A7Z2ZPF9_9BACL|nr:carbohydrate ABC transporter permease [Cohnella herbarum]QJD87124.1 carbohydrate ABC transporter permease [Cohnella herbarum]
MNNRREKWMNAGIGLLTWVLALIVSIPLYLVVINTFKTNKEIITDPLGFPTFKVGFDNIVHAWEKMNVLKAYGTTLSIEAIAVIGGVLLSSFAAYAVARFESKIFGAMYWVFLSGILIPMQAAFIPIIHNMKALGLNNTLLGISLVYMAVISPFAIFVYAGFMRSVPRELEEAAYIDGCSPARTFLQIIFPMLQPITASLFILQFIYVWNDLLLPLVMVNSRDIPTISVSLYKFFAGRGMADMSLLFGGITIVLAPVLILFVSFQRFFVKGLSAGAVKG